MPVYKNITEKKMSESLQIAFNLHHSLVLSSTLAAAGRDLQQNQDEDLPRPAGFVVDRNEVQTS